MRKLLTAIVCLMALNTQAQFVDTSVTSITAYKIVSFKANFTDSSNATYLGVRVIGDDLKSSCQLYYCFLDSTKNVVMQGNKTISGIDYTNWDGNNKYPFTYLGSVFKITFIKP